jgi:hypothetical protein
MTPRQPSPAEQRAGTAMWGSKPHAESAPASSARQAKIRKFTPYRNAAGTVLGYLDVQLASGMIINGCRLMVGPAGRHWIAPPSQQQTNKDGCPRLDPNGKPIWSQIIEFVDNKTRDRFGELILGALRRDYPDAFGDEP